MKNKKNNKLYGKSRRKQRYTEAVKRNLSNALANKDWSQEHNYPINISNIKEILGIRKDDKVDEINNLIAISKREKLEKLKKEKGDRNNKKEKIG